MAERKSPLTIHVTQRVVIAIFHQAICKLDLRAVHVLPDNHNGKSMPYDALKVREKVAQLRRQQRWQFRKSSLKFSALQTLWIRTILTSRSSILSTPYKSSMICGDTAPPNHSIAISPLPDVRHAMTGGLTQKIGTLRNHICITRAHHLREL